MTHKENKSMKDRQSESGYEKEKQEKARLISDNVTKQIATLNKALLTAQRMRTAIVSRQAKIVTMVMNKYYEQQMKTIAESAKSLSKMAEVAPTKFGVESYKILQPYLESTRNFSRIVSMSTPMYFPPEELIVLKEPIKVPKRSAEMKLIERLKACPRGKDGWTEFQDICKEILMHLFVPPLVEPLEQSRTETGLQIRDLILDIPYSVRNFWGYIRDKFDASALVVECKNYSSPIEGNQIVISSKYLGKNRLGRFGVVFSRLDPAESAIKEVKRLWTEDTKLVLCLEDNRLIKMLELKGRNKEPELVIDNAIHEFLRALD